MQNVSQIPTGVAKHCRWVNFGNVAKEVAIMKEDRNGDIYYIDLTTIDTIDKERLYNIMIRPDAETKPLWDVMQNVTLHNGMNALQYFHQLVKGISRDGNIFNPGAGRRGAMIRPAMTSEQQASTRKSPKASEFK